MKILLLIFLVGCAVASVHKALDDTVELLYHDLMLELEDEGHFYYAENDDVRSELGKTLRETLNELIEKIKERFENGKGVRQEVLGKMVDKILQDLLKNREGYREKLVDFIDRYLDKGQIQNSPFADIDLNDKLRELKELVYKIDKEDVIQRLHCIFDDIMGKEVVDLIVQKLFKDDDYREKLVDVIDRALKKGQVEDRAFADTNLKDTLRELRELVYKIDKEELIQKIHFLFGDLLGKEMVDKILQDLLKNREGYREKLVDFIDRYLDKGQIQNSPFADIDLNDKLRELKELVYKIDKEDVIQRLHCIFDDIMGKEVVDMIVQKLFKDDDYREKLVDVIDRALKKGQVEDRAFADTNLKDTLRELRELVYKIDKEELIQKIHFLFGDLLGKEMVGSIVQDLLNDRDDYRKRFVDFIDRFLEKENVGKRSVKELWEKVKDYFKDLHIDLKEKFMKFGEWVKELGSKGLENGKSKIENIRNIAKEFIDHTKGVSKDVAAEALEFLRPYNEDLGALWDQVKDTVKDIVNRKE